MTQQTPLQQEIKDWEEEYKEKFGLCDKDSKDCRCSLELKFIRNLLKNYASYIKEQTVPEEKKIGYSSASEEIPFRGGYNACRQKVVDKFKELGL